MSMESGTRSVSFGILARQPTIPREKTSTAKAT
jgi:hypothetical protein